MTENGDFRKAIVLDNGTGISKNGYAGEDQPRSVFPTVVGRPKLDNILPDVKHYSREWYIGSEAMDLKGVLKLEYPMNHSVFSKDLSIHSPSF